MIVREDRDELLAALRRALDPYAPMPWIATAVARLRESSSDGTVQWACDPWNVMAEAEDGSATDLDMLDALASYLADKEGWDEYQHMMLAVAADCEVQAICTSRWSTRRLLAIAWIISGIWLILPAYGSRFQSWLFGGMTILFNLLLMYWDEVVNYGAIPPPAQPTPFRDAEEVQAALRSAPGFALRPFPGDEDDQKSNTGKKRARRDKRRNRENWLQKVSSLLIGLALLPIMLLMMIIGFTYRDETWETSVRFPRESSASVIPYGYGSSGRRAGSLASKLLR